MMRSLNGTRMVLGLWAVYLLVICCLPLLKPVSGTIFPTYAVAGSEFASGRPLYGVDHPHTDNFRYSPLVASVFVPFALLPLGIGGFVWRILSAAVYLSGLAAWARRQQPCLPLAPFFLCALPLSHASLYNGQANALVMGLLLWSAVLAGNARWKTAAVLIAATALFKGYPLAFGFLLILTAPLQFSVVLAGAIGIGFALPFLAQSSEYVLTQYHFWFANLAHDDRSHFELFRGYQDFHMLLRVVGVSISHEPYLLVQVGMGMLAAIVVGWQVWLKIERRQIVLNALTLGLCWMALFGPSTESSTFILLAPLMAYELVAEHARPRWARIAAMIGSVCFVVSVFAFAFPHHIHRPLIATGIQPFAALMITAAAVRRVLAMRPTVTCSTQSLTPLNHTA